MAGSLLAAIVVACAVTSPQEPHRLLQEGFEPDPRVPAELPPGFYRVLTSASGRPGLPPFGAVGVSDERSAVGSWSLLFRLEGGGMAVATAPTRLPAAAGQVVEASVMVRSDGLVRSRPALQVRALDGAANPVAGAAWSDGSSVPPGAESSAPAAQAGAAGGDLPAGWRLLRVTTPPLPQGTTAVEVALEVGTPAGVDVGDVSGRVWFDELQVWRLPRLTCELWRAREAFESPARVTVSAEGAEEGTRLQLRILDADGRTVVQQDAGSARLALDLAALPPGAYEVRVLCRTDARVLAETSRTFAVLPPVAAGAATEPAAVRFGLELERPSAAALPGVAAAVEALRPAFVLLRIGDPATDGSGRAGLPAIRRWVDDMRRQGTETILWLDQLPPAAAAAHRLEPGAPAGLLACEESAWRPAFGPWLESMGHVVPRWVISGPGTPEVRRACETLVPAFERIPEERITFVQAGATAARREADAAAVAGVLAWERGAAVVALRGGVDVSPDGAEPTAAGMAWRTLAAAAAGVSRLAVLDAGSGIECRLLSRSGAARVLAWLSEEGAARDLQLPFDGVDLSARDLLGAATVLERRQGTVVASLGSTPVVIDGVDPTLGAFLASVRTEPAALAGSTAEQPLAIRFRNPWEVTLEGSLRFVGPVEWGFVPRSQRFTLPPGGEATVRTSTTLPRTQPTGAARVAADFEFTADRGYRLRMEPPIEIGVDAFSCEAGVRAIPLPAGGVATLVELEVRNRSAAALELEATVSAEDGRSRRDGPFRLEPGAAARRTLRLEGAAPAGVTLAVSEANGPLRLVRRLEAATLTTVGRPAGAPPASGTPSAR